MIKKIYNLFKLFSLKQKLRFYFLSIFTLFANFLEILNIFLIFEFVKVISSSEKKFMISDFFKEHNFNFLSSIMGNIQSFGIVLIIFLFLGVILSITLIFFSSRFALITGAEISNSLLNYYLRKNFLFHISSAPSEIINKLKEQTSNVATLILDQVSLMFSKLFLIIPMFLGLFIFNPKVTTISALLFISIYVILFNIFKKKFKFLGLRHTNLTKDKYEILIDSFSGIKEIKFSSKENVYLDNFKSINNELVNVGTKISIYNRFPKYIIEFFTISFVVVLIIFLSKNLNVGFEEIILMLSVFLISSYKILPALQQIYINLSMIKNGIPSLEGIYDDFLEANKFKENRDLDQKLVDTLRKFKKIQLSKVSFNYQNTKLPTLQEISFQITNGEKVGITGVSGSGKSTLIHLISGLIKPNDGKIFIDKTELTKKNLKEWRKNVGFVPQKVYLSNTSIAKNIAFGETDKEIDNKKISKIFDAVELRNLSNNRDMTLELGHDGSRLSGGQMQRIGIARAMYQNPSILIFDEATSSLDNLTENKILNTINNFDNDITLVMVTHKINLIRNFDKILFLEDGKISSMGKFEQLYSGNIKFKELVDLEEKKIKNN